MLRTTIPGYFTLLYFTVDSTYVHTGGRRKVNLESSALMRLRAGKDRPTSPLLREVQSSLQPSIDINFHQFCCVSFQVSLFLLAQTPFGKDLLWTCYSTNSASA